MQRGARRLVWLAGPVNIAIPYALSFWSLQTVTPAIAGMLRGAIPLFVIFLGVLTIRKHDDFSTHKSFGVLIGLVGITLVLLPTFIHNELRASLWGTVAATGASLFYAVGALMNRYINTKYPHVDSLSLLINHLCVSFLFLLAFSVVTEGAPDISTFPEWRIVGSFLYLGIVANTVAFLIFYPLIRTWGTVPATATTFLVTVMATGFGYVFFGTIPHLLQIAGTVVIFAGIICIQSRTREAGNDRKTLSHRTVPAKPSLS